MKYGKTLLSFALLLGLIILAGCGNKTTTSTTGGETTTTNETSAEDPNYETSTDIPMNFECKKGVDSSVSFDLPSNMTFKEQS